MIQNCCKTVNNTLYMKFLHQLTYRDLHLLLLCFQLGASDTSNCDNFGPSAPVQNSQCRKPITTIPLSHISRYVNICPLFSFWIYTCAMLSYLMTNFTYLNNKKWQREREMAGLVQHRFVRLGQITFKWNSNKIINWVFILYIQCVESTWAFLSDANCQYCLESNKGGRLGQGTC